MLHTAAPNAPILGLLLDPQNPNQDARANDVLGPAQKIGVQTKLVRASAARDFGNVFAELAQSRAGGLVIADDEFFLSASVGLASLALRNSLPAIFQGTAFATAGGLVSYGTRLADITKPAPIAALFWPAPRRLTCRSISQPQPK